MQCTCTHVHVHVCGCTCTCTLYLHLIPPSLSLIHVEIHWRPYTIREVYKTSLVMFGLWVQRSNIHVHVWGGSLGTRLINMYIHAHVNTMYIHLQYLCDSISLRTHPPVIGEVSATSLTVKSDGLAIVHPHWLGLGGDDRGECRGNIRWSLCTERNMFILTSIL